MKLTKAEGRDIVYGDHPDWVCYEKDIVDTSRWSIQYNGVFLHKPSGKHYRLYWQIGATEQQDEQAFEYDDPAPVEVVSREIIATEWVDA